MSRKLTSHSALEQLRKEAKRWLKALRAGDANAHARLARTLPNAPVSPTLRDVQLALAREHGLAGWIDLKRAVTQHQRALSPREQAVQTLLRAAAQGDAAAVSGVLDEFPDIIDERAELEGHTGRRTALHFGSAHRAVVQVLLERGANPNIRDDGDDAMPLHFAAERGDLDIVRLLVEHGADPVGSGTVHDLNVLGWAVCWDYAHHAAVAEYLLAHGAQHTIHTAVALGAVDVIRELVAHSPAVLEQPMDRTNRRRRPLHLAVIKQRVDAARALLELGADTEAIDAAGLTPLDQAALLGTTELVDVLLQHGARVRLPAALALGRDADIERALRDQPDALKPGQPYGTLIVRAAERASGAVIERLIAGGAAVNARDDADTAVDQTAGYTALHAAAFNDNLDAIEVLLRHGANPNLREQKYGSTPAGWAAYAGHEAACRRLLEAEIDLFQAIDFDLVERIPRIALQSPWLLHQPFRKYAPWEPPGDDWIPEPWHTPLVWAVVKHKPAAVEALLDAGALPMPAPDGRTLLELAQAAGHDDIVRLLQQYEHFAETPAGRVRLFVRNACPDHDIRGPWHHVLARHTALCLLQQHPGIAQDSFITALICGDVAAVERELAARPQLAREKGGPKQWEPLLYLTFTRLPLAAVTENAVAIATLLLDHGADPNVFFKAGDSSYTPLVGAIGEGEEHRPPHQQRDALVRLLLERGAEPYDTQVIYNIHFQGRVLWYLQLMYEHALRRGRKADWQDPEWSMLDMGGYGSGARWHLHIAIEQHDLQLAEWLLAHGASPNSPPARDPRLPQHSLIDEATRRGQHDMAALLLRHGASPPTATTEPAAELAQAALRLDRARLHELLAGDATLLQSTTAMFEAAKQDRADVVALLLELGFAADVEDEQQQHALHIAAYHDAAAAARLLLQHGAEADAVERNYQNTPLAAAVYAHASRVIELLGPHSRDVWNLTYTGHVARLRQLFAEQPELARTTSEDGETLLMWLPNDEAAALEIIELLLQYGADPARRSRDGRTAADYAVRRGMERAAARLRAAANQQRNGGT